MLIVQYVEKVLKKSWYSMSKKVHTKTSSPDMGTEPGSESTVLTWWCCLEHC